MVAAGRPKPAPAIIMLAFPASVSAIEIPLVSAIVGLVVPSLSQASGRRNFSESWFLTVSRGEEGRQRLIRRMTRNVVKSS